MADDCDRAQVNIDREMDFLMSSRPAQSVLPSAYECAECFEPIPEARRLSLPGVQLCVNCQAINEMSA